MRVISADKMFIDQIMIKQISDLPKHVDEMTFTDHFGHLIQHMFIFPGLMDDLSDDRFPFCFRQTAIQVQLSKHTGYAGPDKFIYLCIHDPLFQQLDISIERIVDDIWQCFSDGIPDQHIQRFQRQASQIEDT